MDINVIVKSPSSHRLFKLSPDIAPGHVRARTTGSQKRNIHRSGPARTAHITHGHVGKFIGIMDSIAELPIEGEATLSASRGKYELTGTLWLYSPVLKAAVDEALEAAKDVGVDLSRDPDLKDVTVTYSIKIQEINGR